MLAKHIQAKELDANTEYYIELLAKGIGKSKEEIAKDVQRPKYFQAQEAIDYGIVDKIIDSRDAAFEKRVIFHCYSCLLFILCKHIVHNILIVTFWIRIMMKCLLNQELQGDKLVAILKLLLQDLGNHTKHGFAYCAPYPMP